MHLRRSFTIPGHEASFFDVIVEAVEPERRFAWRWHPRAIELGVDFAQRKRTLVEFTLEDTPEGGTIVRVVESGLDAVPAERRARAFRGNSGGWRAQMQQRLLAFVPGA